MTNTGSAKPSDSLRKMNIMTMDSNLTLNKKVKCPKCESENVICLDGSGAVSKYGDNVMIDIAPDMWLCQDCKESFRIEDTE